jgi:hypothetical protein
MYTNVPRKKQIEYLLHKRLTWNRWQCSKGHQRAHLEYAHLEGANLRYANLEDAHLEGANLRGTCLDPMNKCSSPDAVVAALAVRGIAPNSHGNFVAYRTQRSRYVGNTIYQHGHTYVAPWFSTSKSTDCHPGLYFCERNGVNDADIYGMVAIVTNIRDVVVAGNKLRCRKFRVTQVINPAKGQ